MILILLYKIKKNIKVKMTKNILKDRIQVQVIIVIHILILIKLLLAKDRRMLVFYQYQQDSLV